MRLPVKSLRLRLQDWKVKFYNRSSKARVLITLLGVSGSFGLFAFCLDQMDVRVPFPFAALGAFVSLMVLSWSIWQTPVLCDVPRGLKILLSMATFCLIVWILWNPSLMRYKQWAGVAQIDDGLSPIQSDTYRQLVAETVYALDPNAQVDIGPERLGPDGLRRIDIAVHSMIEGQPASTIIEVLDLPSGEPVGIETIDALDSKRIDIGADFALVCSNTGFDEIAIQKAKRKGIGLISVLRQGDERVRTVIEEGIYLRKVNVHPISIIYHAANPTEGRKLQSERGAAQDLRYEGKPIAAWLEIQAINIVVVNPNLTKPVTHRFNLKSPTWFQFPSGQNVKLVGFTISFLPRVQWLSQTVQIDAKVGIYDYIRGRLRLADGENSYVIKGVNFDTAIPIQRPPSPNEVVEGLGSDEMHLCCAMAEGTNFRNEDVPIALNQLVRQEDLPVASLGLHFHVTPAIAAGVSRSGQGDDSCSGDSLLQANRSCKNHRRRGQPAPGKGNRSMVVG